MNLHNIFIMSHGRLENPPLTQPIDLDYVVSISPIDLFITNEHCLIGESTASFLIYLKMGEPIKITYGSGSTTTKIDTFPKYILDTITSERNKLIKAWESKSSARIPNWGIVELDCGVNTIPESDLQRGRREGVKDCFEYLNNKIVY